MATAISHNATAVATHSLEAAAPAADVPTLSFGWQDGWRRWGPLCWAYCLLPCALKLLAATLLYTLILRRTP